MLWCVAFLLLLALAVTVPLLYWTVVGSGRDGSPIHVDAPLVLAGVAGMVLVFCLYTALKQRELEQMRVALAHEEREKEDVRARLSELSALFQVSTSLNLHLPLDAILEIIVRRVVATLRAQQASIMIFNPEVSLLETRASFGLESEFARHARKKLGEGIAGWVAQRKESVLLNAEGASGPFVRHFKSNRNITSALSLPLKVGDRCVGVLNVNRINHPDTFKEHHREILCLFAEHVGTAIERAERMDRLGERNRELEAANQRLNEINRLKDVFLSTASHELKTPLTSVIAYAELLDDHEQRLDDRQRIEFVGRLRGEAHRLLVLIEEILDLSRIESGKLVLRRVRLDIAALVRTAIQTSAPLAQKYGVRLREQFEAGAFMLTVDEVKVRQVIVNLIINALKFSPADGEVVVGLAGEPDAVRIEVSDRGPGVAPEDSAHIFELFGQGLRQSSGQREGLGIGLHLVKRLTELHGGHVGVNSTPGGGSTFWIRLPLADSDSTEARSDRIAA
ncbi:MAG: GAF domain-containing sensor histidine kinase [Candidatus Eisenbacteria bacterium]|nr:GAF domain-containing sensor histidine kinase [Candidatus Eisenbacteria bacterium]